MRTRTHAHTRGLTPRPALLRGFAAPRQLPATHFSPMISPSCPGGFAPGWRLTAQLPKVNQKCRKVAKSLEVKKSFLIFAPNLKFTDMKRMRKIYGKGAKVWYYRYLTSTITEIYDENKRYKFDVSNLNEFKEIFC